MVLNERAVEFGFEEIRWFDLVRWKRAEDFTKPLYGVKIWRQADGSYKYEKWAVAETLLEEELVAQMVFVCIPA